MGEKFYPNKKDVELCVFCYYARMRTDICGIYCTKGFVVDGKCERFREYQTNKEKRDRHGGGRDDLKNKGGVCYE